MAGTRSFEFRRIRARHRTLAEAVRAYEGLGGAVTQEYEAERIAREWGGDFETRVARRAAALGEAGVLRVALSRVRQVLALVVVLAIVLSAVAGAGAARAALGEGDRPVSVYWMLLGVLGLQTLLLATWCFLMVLRLRAANVSGLGALVTGLARHLVERAHRREGPAYAAAVRAEVATHARGVTGRWTLSAISHTLWLAFNLGLGGFLLVQLSAREYTFRWETTILQAETYEDLTAALGAAPQAVGFAVPTRDAVAASGPGATAEALETNRAAWSQFLIGCVALYGAAPRAALLLISLVMAAHARRRSRLDLDDPAYLRLRDRLEREQPAPEPAPIQIDAPDAVDAAPAGPGQPAIVGFEIDPPVSGWPPRLHGVRFSDLGFVDGSAERRRLREELVGLEPAPALVLIVCDLTTTPDRGIGAALAEVAAIAPIGLVLTGGNRFRNRGGDIETRLADWHTLAERAAVPPERIADVDLDHLSEGGVARLNAVLAGQPGAGARRSDRLADAFDQIVAFARAARHPDDADARARLHERIARLYRDESIAWRARLGVPADLADARNLVQRGAERATAYLPDRLRTSPRWMTVGAAAGALGCVAVGLLVAPAALAALPGWTGLGAALGAALRAVTPASAEAAPEPEDQADALGAAVASAAVFAIVLDGQGAGERAIESRLDAALPVGADPPRLSGAAAAEAWLDGVLDRVRAGRRAEAPS